MSLTNSKFHDFLSKRLSSIPISDIMSDSHFKKNKILTAKNKRLQKQNSIFKQMDIARKKKIVTAQQITKKIALRTTKNISRNVSSVFAESVPYLGVGFILAVTASDVYDGCKTVKDTNELLKLLNADESKNLENTVCGMEVPTQEEVKKSWKKYKRNLDDIIGGIIYEMLH